MKKTIIALMALAGVAVAADGELTEVYTYDTLKEIGTATGSGTNVLNTTDYNTPVYDCSGALSYTNINATDITKILHDTSGTQTLTLAAWVNYTTPEGYIKRNGDNQMLFSWGENSTGIKFGLNYFENELKITVVTKDQAAMTSGPIDTADADTLTSPDAKDGRITSGQWTLIALSMTRRTDGNFDFILRNAGETTGTTTWDFPNRPLKADPSTSDAIGLLTSSSNAASEVFASSLGKFSIFTSTGLASDVTNASILAAMGEAPKSIPEPATAMLSLLALAGLAARRRRR